LPYNLLFERFLNPERISMPDIDVDFCQDQREKVIEYVVEKYGRERVCQIITFGTMKAKAVVRDVGRALSMAYGDVDRIAKLIPDDLKMTVPKAIEQEPQLRELRDSDPQIKELLETAICLEGWRVTPAPMPPGWWWPRTGWRSSCRSTRIRRPARSTPSTP